jgi:TolB-like protein/Tfp pilus assembly protein PilF
MNIMSSGPVFISYASHDEAIARRICAALEAAEFPCWIAPRDVLAGEPYAAAIVEAINACRMVVLVLTQSAIQSPHVLREVERASSKKRSILSVRLDAAQLPPELEYFLSANHWLEVPGGAIEAALPALIESVRGRESVPGGYPVGGNRPTSSAESVGRIGAPAPPKPNNRRTIALGAGLALLALLGYWVINKSWLAKHTAADSVAPLTTAASTAAPSAASAGATVAFAPPPHSIAVLPFLNMSGDPKQDYFSDGLSEELLNSLASIRDLRVAARTSSFFFKGKEVDLSDVAHKLNVASVLEGSVRKDGDHVRITAQLINAVTGFHLWSQTYDRDLKDVLKLQTDIATAVTNALQATLLVDAAATIELGGTQNPKAFDAYLRGKNSGSTAIDRGIALGDIAAFDEAIRLDPTFAKAYTSKALAENGFAEYYGVGPEIRDHVQRARSAAETALKLAPDLGEAHSALARVLADGFLEFRGALAEHERALSLSPNDPSVLLRAAWFFVDIGRTDPAVAMARRGTSLDQLNYRAYRTLAIVLDDAHQYREAIEAATRSLSLRPDDLRQSALIGLSLLHLEEPEAARKSCEQPSRDWENRLCLAIAYDKLHRRPEAEQQVADMKKELGESTAYQYAEIYAQWNEIGKAIDWLETAYRLKDSGFIDVKVDEFLTPLHHESRYQQIVAKLNFPE